MIPVTLKRVLLKACVAAAGYVMCSSLPSPCLHACIHWKKWGSYRPGGVVFTVGGLDGNKITRRIKWIFLWCLSKCVSICRGRKVVKNFSTGGGN